MFKREDAESFVRATDSKAKQIMDVTMNKAAKSCDLSDFLRLFQDISLDLRSVEDALQNLGLSQMSNSLIVPLEKKLDHVIADSVQIFKHSCACKIK